jgi:hypothetical protein
MILLTCSLSTFNTRSYHHDRLLKDKASPVLYYTNCPAQSAIIEQAAPTSELQKVYTLLREMQRSRKLLEDSFVQAVVG